MFGKKKKQESITLPEETIPMPQEQRDESELESLKSKLAALEKKTAPEPVKQEKEAKIIAAEDLGNGLFRFTLVSNTILGDVGSVFEWRD